MRFGLIVAALGIALSTLGCAPHAIGKPVVWPDPPDPPRIKFVTAFRTADDLDHTGWGRFKRALLGNSKDPGLMQPMGLALSDDGQRLYIADLGQAHVLIADFEKQSLKMFAGDETMGKPFNVALDADENVYVSDSGGQQVIVFSKKGDRLRSIGRNQIERPTGLAIDRARRVIYVSDSSNKKSEHHRVRAFSLDGKFLFDLGSAQAGKAKGEAEGQFYFPTYLTLDHDGNVYVADTMNFRIQVFGPDGKFIRKFGEGGDGPGFFARIKGLAFDGFGNFYVVDGDHSNVQIFNREFQALMFFGGYAQRIEYFDIPSGIAIQPKTNRIYVCNEFVSRINVYELFNTKLEDSAGKPSAPAATPRATSAR